METEEEMESKLKENHLLFTVAVRDKKPSLKDNYSYKLLAGHPTGIAKQDSQLVNKVWILPGMLSLHTLVLLRNYIWVALSRQDALAILKISIF